MNHPVIYSKIGRWVYTLIWIVIFGLLFWLLWGLDAFHPVNALVDSLFIMLPLLPMGLSIWYLVLYIDFESLGLSGVIWQHLSAAIVGVGIWMSATYYGLQWWYGTEDTHLKVLDDEFHWFVLGAALIYLLMVLFYYLVVYYNQFKQKLLREVHMESLVREAELNVLKSQINPHFLFNSLNSVSALTLSSPERAREMVVKLSEFLRSCIFKEFKERETLEKELSTMRLYLEIERVRFGDRLITNFHVERECLGMSLPNLILQPIYENAIKHGVNQSCEPVTISTRCAVREGVLLVTVENNFDPEALPIRGTGIGLKNIQDRLNLIYRGKDLMRIIKKESLFQVKLEFPQISHING